MTDPMPKILAFDTTHAHCAAAILQDGAFRALRTEEMRKGQAERLMGLLQDCLEEANLAWSDLDALAVGIGPGNFTGIRIAVSAVRGLALALGIPVYGVDGLAQRAHLYPQFRAAVPAPRDNVYTIVDDSPAMMPLSEAEELDYPLCPDPTPEDLARAIAEIAADRWPEPGERPAPLYIKPPDAAPAKDPGPQIIA
ncbi:MAG: tRNA (adenosine(37)-N6)-threonylcarbamoyltransferase complex dimerization subunit type 1 TsaB [Pseudomonadota bacterium]